MTELRSGIATPHTDGKKNIDFTMTAGTAKLQISVNGSTPKDIESTSKTANANFNITIPDCDITAVLTGDATAISSSIR